MLQSVLIYWPGGRWTYLRLGNVHPATPCGVHQLHQIKVYQILIGNGIWAYSLLFQECKIMFAFLSNCSLFGCVATKESVIHQQQDLQ